MLVVAGAFAGFALPFCVLGAVVLPVVEGCLPVVAGVVFTVVPFAVGGLVF